MVKENTALFVVDVQNDFLPRGALAVPEGDKIIDGIVAISHDYDLVVASKDWHPHDHISFEAQGGHWPKHCVQGTWGAELDSKITTLASVIAIKGDDKEKEEYTASIARIKGFGNVRDLLDDFEAIDVVGLALDYCVKATATDFALNGWETTVWLDLTRPVAWETGALAISELVASGVNLQSSGAF